MVSCNKMSSLETTKKVHNLAGLRTIKVKFVSNIYIALCVTIIISKPVGLVLPAFKVKHPVEHLSSANLLDDIC